jgi:hypothetical protein
MTITPPEPLDLSKTHQRTDNARALLEFSVFQSLTEKCRDFPVY